MVLFVAPAPARADDCLSIHEAAQHIGETKCVSGKVLKVKVGNKGVHFLDFCEDAIACPFTVVVFAGDLKDVGDIRLLSGRNIEIRGALKMYDGRPEIILNRISQIEGGAAMIPPLPKNYDVENRGRFSAGRLYPSKKPKKAKPQKPERHRDLRKRRRTRRSAIASRPASLATDRTDSHGSKEN